MITDISEKCRSCAKYEKHRLAQPNYDMYLDCGGYHGNKLCAQEVTDFMRGKITECKGRVSK